MIIEPIAMYAVTTSFLDTLEALRPVDMSVYDAVDLYIHHYPLEEAARLGHVYVAHHGVGDVVGAATLLTEKKFIHGGGIVAHVEDVAVRPSHQGQGVGTQLLVRLEAEARRRGAYKAVLACTEELVPFYEKLGYHRAGVQMRKDLLP